MPRDKEFDTQEALQRAMLLFWEKGYLETSYEDLVKATGVNRYGLYSAFGDKQQFFLAAMDYYSNHNIQFLLGPMEKPEGSLREIRRYFTILVKGLGSPQGRFGCLIGNCAVETATPEDMLFSRISAHFDRMRAAFLNALQNAQQHGEIGADLDAEAVADYLVGVANGFLVCVRSQMETRHIKNFITVALDQIG